MGQSAAEKTRGSLFEIRVNEPFIDDTDATGMALVPTPGITA